MFDLQQIQPKAGTPSVSDPGGHSPTGPAPVGPAAGTSPLAVGLVLAFVIVLVYVAKLALAKKEGSGGSVTANGQAVVVTDVQMPFGSMVVFMVKWALASIPAMIIVAIVGASVTMLGGMLIALLH